MIDKHDKSDEVFLNLVAMINYPDKLSVSNDIALQRLHNLTNAEIAVLGMLCDKQQRRALFTPKDKYELFCMHDDYFIGFNPEDFTVFGDAETEISVGRNDIQHSGRNTFTAEELGLNASKLEKDKLFYRGHRQHNNISAGWGQPTSRGDESFNLNQISNIQPSGKEPYFPMLTLIGIKWSVLRRRKYSIDMVAAELFERGFATRSELLTPIHGLPPEHWTETLSEPYTPSESKLAYTAIEYFHDPDTALSMRGLWIKAAAGIPSCCPVVYYQHKDRNHPTSFLSAPAHKMPLDRQNLESGNPIVVTEYLNISRNNGDNKKIAVVSWLGGAVGIARTDLTPLLGKTFYYLLKLADNEKDGKRAVDSMLKFFSTLKAQGFFHFKILDTIYCDIIDEGRIGLLCQRYKVEIPDNLAGENCGLGLNWQPAATVGSTIFGRSVQEGRLHLMHSPNGTGKTLFTQVMANILIRGDAPDFGEPLSFQPGRIFRFFYIQSEMQAGDVPHDDMQERQKRLDRLFGKALPKGMLTFYKPAGDICKLSEQESIVSRLAELDPDGKSQWIIVVDNILSVMPSATSKSGYDKIKPWFEALKALGITIFLIHHDNLENGSYGTSAILNDADSRWHITLTDQVRDEIVQALPSEIRNDLNTYGQLQDATETLARMNTAARKVYVKVGKGRHLSASDMRPFSIQWTLSDTVQKLSSEYSDYSDLEAIVQKKLVEYKARLELSGGKNTTTPDCDMNSTAAPSEVSIEANGSSTGQTQVYAGALPTSFAGLKGLNGETQRQALLELRLKHGSIKAVGRALDCSESSIEGLCQDHGINRKAVEVYAAMKDAEVK